MRKSIHIRFQFAFGLSVLGLVMMSVVAVSASRAILDSYEISVKEARLETLPILNLQRDLREIDRAAFRFAVDGDRLAPGQYRSLAAQVDGYFHDLAFTHLRVRSTNHSRGAASLSDALSAWSSVKVKMGSMFSHQPGTAEAFEAAKRAHYGIDPVYGVINRFQTDMLAHQQEHLLAAQETGKDNLMVLVGAMLVGVGVMIGMGCLVGHSVLRPIEQLRVAAARLGQKDFSHRVRLSNRLDELGQLAFAINRASATLDKLYRELERRSTRDGLTGLFNRASFDERLETELSGADRHGRPLSLLMIDIDRFKRVNDTHGHQAGDLVLQSVAELLEQATRPGDIVTRYGGEEFAVILPDTGEEAALSLAERLRVVIEKTPVRCANGVELGLTASIGCASRLPDGASPAALAKAADSALYRAKRTGRNRVSSAGRSAGRSDPAWQAA